MTHRTITLYCKNYIVPEISSSPKAETNIKNNYMEVVDFFQNFEENFYKEHVSKIFIECISGDNLPIHFFFCREVAVRYGLTVEFTNMKNKFIVTKDTPEDWFDICEYDINDKRSEYGPDYIDITAEEAKHGIWLCRNLMEWNQDNLIHSIRGDWWRTQHSYFKSYDEYKKWSMNLYQNIFLNQRKLFHYSTVLQNYNETLTEEDVARFEKKSLEKIKQFSLENGDDEDSPDEQ